MPLTFDPVIPFLDYILKRGITKYIMDMFEKLLAADSLVTIMATVCNTRRKYIKNVISSCFYGSEFSFLYFISLFLTCFTFIVK